MPMLDLTIPKGALSPEGENSLVAKLTDLLLLHEGADPANPIARSMAWVFVHRADTIFVSGKPAEAPRYRAQVSIPEGQFDDERRSKMVEAITNAILDSEADVHPREAHRVWVFASEVPEGTWGAGGKIYRLADIVQLVIGDRDKACAYAERRLAACRTDRNGKLQQKEKV